MTRQTEVQRLRKLLGRYATHIIANEGVDFLEDFAPYDHSFRYRNGDPAPQKFTAEEAEEIRRCCALNDD